VGDAQQIFGPEAAAVNAALEEGLKQKKKRPPTLTFEEEKHRYTIDGQFVPSVTQIIKLQDPFEAGPWWGMRVGMAGLIDLMATGQLSYGMLQSLDPDAIRSGADETLEKLLTAGKLTVNHVKEERGDEGTAIHHALETMGATGAPPRLSDFDPELRGYIQAFSKWFVDMDPEVLFNEIIVGSREHRYAGRIDTGVECWDDEADAPGVEVVDYKTSARSKGPQVYDKFHLQGCGYKLAYNELRQWQKDAPRAVRSSTVVLHNSGIYLRETHLCPDARWLAAVRLWWEHEPFLDEIAKRRNKSGKRRKR
jgi:hypothetical protein